MMVMVLKLPQQETLWEYLIQMEIWEVLILRCLFLYSWGMVLCLISLFILIQAVKIWHCNIIVRQMMLSINCQEQHSIQMAYLLQMLVLIREMVQHIHFLQIIYQVMLQIQLDIIFLLMEKVVVTLMLET